MKINQDTVPTSMEEAVTTLLGSLSDEDKEVVIAETSSSLHHHSAGRILRNEWSFWEWDTPHQARLHRDLPHRSRRRHVGSPAGVGDGEGAGSRV